MTRPSSTRSTGEREKDVATIWIMEFLLDISASMEVVSDFLESTDSAALMGRATEIDELKTEFDKVVKKVDDA